MKIEKIAQCDFLETVFIPENFDSEILIGHTGDLLSEVMRNRQENSIWVTHQSHQNIIAVSEVTGAKAIVIAENLNFNADTVESAKDASIALFKTKLSAFECCGKLYNLLKND